jgi:hypothetical protein
MKLAVLVAVSATQIAELGKLYDEDELCCRVTNVYRAYCLPTSFQCDCDNTLLFVLVLSSEPSVR